MIKQKTNQAKGKKAKRLGCKKLSAIIQKKLMDIEEKKNVSQVDCRTEPGARRVFEEMESSSTLWLTKASVEGK